MTQATNARGQWRSTAGFVLAAAGSAIGLGNIWRFPYVTGTNGGAAFVLIYLACVALVCLPYLFGELALGRHTQRNPVGAVAAIRPGSRWRLAGGLGVLTGLCILSYYAVIAGWAVGYIFKGLIAADVGHTEFIGSSGLTIVLLGLFVGLTALVVGGGVERGIERCSKVLMPVLLVLMLLLIVRGLTLDGSYAGVEFLFAPDFSKVGHDTVVAALGQAFFSLSLGMGAMITYGSYLPPTANLRRAGLHVALFDTGIALLAGLMIFPALFALGKEAGSGPTLIFEVLPALFAEMPLGQVVGVAFFALLSIAALTSTVSLLEVVVAWCVDELGWPRRRAVTVLGLIAFALGVPSALSQGAVAALGEFTLFGRSSVLYVMDYLWGNVALALGAMLLSLFIGWVWGVDGAGAELRRGSGASARWVAVWGVFVRAVCPALIFLVLLNLFGVV